MTKPRVGILTTFYNFDRSYSLCSVVESQLVALVKYGYNPILFVHDNFKDDDRVPQGVEIRKVVPRFSLTDYSANQEVSEELGVQAELAFESLKNNTKDIDIIIEHDLIFQGWFLPYCIAIHKLSEQTNIKWFHWIHSVPNLQPANIKFPHILRYNLPKNSKLVYLNGYHIVRAAESYNIFPKDVRIVYNSLDPRLFFDLHPLISHLIEKYDILSADIIQTYPLSTPRMNSGKGLLTLIELFGKLKKQRKKVKLIVCNAHANAPQEKNLIEETLQIASEKELRRDEIIFTSLENPPTYELGIPRQAISQLFLLSNLFVFPSISENCSLILLEAMLAKNLLVLNEDVPPMREFGRENALYFRFGGLDQKTEYANKELFLEDVAKIIISELNIAKPLNASTLIKQRFNYDWIFKNQIEPLFYENS